MLKAIDKLHEGLLLQKKKTMWVSISGLVDLFSQLAVLAILVGTTMKNNKRKEDDSNDVGNGTGDDGYDEANLFNNNPMFPPIAALYVGMVLKMIVVGIGMCCVYGRRQSILRPYEQSNTNEDFPAIPPSLTAFSQPLLPSYCWPFQEYMPSSTSYPQLLWI